VAQWYVNLLLIRNGADVIRHPEILFLYCVSFLVRQVGLVVRVGRKRAIYIPKSVAEELGLKEGDRILLEVVDGKIVLTPVKLRGVRRFWGEVSVVEVEEVGEEVTKEVTEGE